MHHHFSCAHPSRPEGNRQTDRSGTDNEDIGTGRQLGKPVSMPSDGKRLDQSSIGQRKRYGQFDSLRFGDRCVLRISTRLRKKSVVADTPLQLTRRTWLALTARRDGGQCRRMIAHREVGHVGPHRHDFAGELVSEHRPGWNLQKSLPVGQV
ncbi:hypothetical protein P5W08_24630 [Mycobacteroides abscessus subsp. bolletii]|nr:hypothetical protein [Mycobacteroides abscessus]MDO3336473.1 hypothetical protein [Mycobacteroides abscessus subsp. bolletii]